EDDVVTRIVPRFVAALDLRGNPGDQGHAVLAGGTRQALEPVAHRQGEAPRQLELIAGEDVDREARRLQERLQIGRVERQAPQHQGRLEGNRGERVARQSDWTTLGRTGGDDGDA